VSLTLDASVWLAAMSPAEREHEQCAELVACIKRDSIALHQPGLFVIEVCATIARRTRNRTLALAAGDAAIALPRLTLHPLDLMLTVSAADAAATCALRGADAVYVATARHAGTTLLTLDAEVLNRASSLVTVMTPAAWIKERAQ
jgi:predicted nucleic acid-binding protein